MSKEKRGKRSNLRLCFDRKWNNWNPLRLITWVARQPKDGSNCPSLFMSELWKILLPLVTTLYEMQWLEVLVPTLTDNPTMPLKIHLSVTAVEHRSWAMGRKQKQSGSVIMSLCIIHNISHPHCIFIFLGNSILLNYIRYPIQATSSLRSLLLMDLSSLLLKYACNYCDSNYNNCIIQINLVLGLDHLQRR